MNKKLDIHNFWYSNIFIILIFAFISLVSGFLFWHSKFVIGTTDLYFHWQRIYDLRDSILHGYINPTVALNKINQTGSAVMAMYPKLNLYPIILLSFIFKSFTNLMLSIFILRNFFALLVGYYSCYNYKQSKSISFVFSVSYTLTALFLFYGIQGYDIGVSSSIIFMPLVLFGFLELLRKNSWIELTIGMSCIILCHVLNTAIIVLFLLIFFMFNIRKFQDNLKVCSLLKAVIFTTLITSIFWMPFFILNMNNSISLPANNWLLNGTDISTLIFTSLDNSVSTATISFTGVVGIVLALIFYKNMPVYSKQLFVISIVFIIICSNLFPWSILEHTFIKEALQFPTRLYVIPQLLLNFLFAENLFKLTDNDHIKRELLTFCTIVVVLCLQLGAQEQLINSNKNNESLNKPFWWHSNYVIKSNSDFHNLINSNAQIQDYYPKSSINSTNELNNHLATYNNKYLRLKLIGNGEYVFNSKVKVNKLTLPFLYYNGINYQVKLDSKTVKGYPNKNALMTINNVHKGKHHVQIIVHKTKVEIASYILSLIGLLILIGAILKNFLKKRKNK